MKVVYTAPNRGHHYIYAKALLDANILYRFVSGFSRFNSLSKSINFNGKLYRVDFLQNVYLVCLKFNLPEFISSTFAYLAKKEQDLACRKIIKDADIFIFYNGSGLNTCLYVKNSKTICIVEAVNSHVAYQENILQVEHEKLGLKWMPFHKKEKERRLKEYEIADYILVPSEFVRNSFLQMGFSTNKLLKVPYGFNSFKEQKISPTSKVSGSFTVLYVGSISIRKGLRYLIKAFYELKHHDKKLVIVGPMTNQSGISDLDISKQIIFTGILKGEALAKMYQTADVFCLPSIEDGFGLVLGEALSYGIPVITTTNTGAEDIVTEGKDGFIVPVCDSNSIVEKLSILANNGGILQEMKNAAMLKAASFNGWDKTGDNLVNTLKNLTK